MFRSHRSNVSAVTWVDAAPGYGFMEGCVVTGTEAGDFIVWNPNTLQNIFTGDAEGRPISSIAAIERRRFDGRDGPAIILGTDRDAEFQYWWTAPGGNTGNARLSLKQTVELTSGPEEHMYSNDFKWMHMYNGSCFDRDVDALFVRNVRSAGGSTAAGSASTVLYVLHLSGQGFSNITELNVSMPIISFAVAEGGSQRTSTLYCVQSGAIQKYSVPEPLHFVPLPATAGEGPSGAHDEISSEEFDAIVGALEAVEGSNTATAADEVDDGDDENDDVGDAEDETEKDPVGNESGENENHEEVREENGEDDEEQEDDDDEDDEEEDDDDEDEEEEEEEEEEQEQEPKDDSNNDESAPLARWR